MLKRFFVRKKLARWALLAGLAPALALAIAELWWIHHAKRFQEIRPGVLYRTGQPSEHGLRYLVRSQGIRTVVCLQTFDPKLRRGHYDPGQPNGRLESQVARDLNVRLEQWPLGEEACWPWPSPWHLEEFFKLLDEPSNRPVLIHCQGGRHRTGTLAALFRLEYDRWPVEQALKEMYSFNFGHPVQWQELNLRTYLPRPRPLPRQWLVLRSELGSLFTETPPADYEGLVLALRRYRDRARLRTSMEAYLNTNQPFALPLAARLIDSPDDPMAATATRQARRVLHEDNAAATDWAIAAALIADFGTPEEQAELLALIAAEPRDAPVSPRYAAMAAGVMNRYTRNRLPYLRPIVEDTRPWPESGARGARFCDVALARMTGIVDVVFYAHQGNNGWDSGRHLALAWFEQHSDATQPSQLVPPMAPRVVQALSADESAARKRR